MLGTNNNIRGTTQIETCVSCSSRTYIRALLVTGAHPVGAYLQKAFSPALRSPFTSTIAPRSHHPRLAVPNRPTLLVSVNGCCGEYNTILKFCQALFANFFKKFFSGPLFCILPPPALHFARFIYYKVPAIFYTFPFWGRGTAPGFPAANR